MILDQCRRRHCWLIGKKTRVVLVGGEVKAVVCEEMKQEDNANLVS